MPYLAESPDVGSLDGQYIRRTGREGTVPGAQRQLYLARTAVLPVEREVHAGGRAVKACVASVGGGDGHLVLYSGVEGCGGAAVWGGTGVGRKDEWGKARAALPFTLRRKLRWRGWMVTTRHSIMAQKQRKRSSHTQLTMSGLTPFTPYCVPPLLSRFAAPLTPAPQAAPAPPSTSSRCIDSRLA